MKREKERLAILLDLDEKGLEKSTVLALEGTYGAPQTIRKRKWAPAKTWPLCAVCVLRASKKG
jgi:hypothetical protein